MLTGIIIFLVVIMLAGILYFGGYFAPKQKTREQYLEELTEYLDGTKEPIEGRENSFRINFNFEGKQLFIEDVEERGFKDIIHKVYLKAKTPKNLTLYFSEKEQKAVKLKTIIASEIPDEPLKKIQRLELPESLKELHAVTNDIDLTNKLLAIPKIAQIFTSFKNKDPRGYPFVSLKIEEGVVILEFSSSRIFKPNQVDLYESVASIEHYLNKLLILVKMLDKMSA